MRIAIEFCFCVFLFISCHKDDKTAPQTCNIQQAYGENAKKVTISNGVWGTVSSVEGDCMPTVPVCSSCCRNCPVERTVKIYQYTTLNNAVTSDPYKDFFDKFNTQFVTQVDTDENGFFQTDIPAGHYTIVVVENGKLYGNTRDGQEGISPFVLSAGIKNINLAMTYKATF